MCESDVVAEQAPAAVEHTAAALQLAAEQGGEDMGEVAARLEDLLSAQPHSQRLVEDVEVLAARAQDVESNAEWWQYLQEAKDLTNWARNGLSLEENRKAINLINRLFRPRER